MRTFFGDHSTYADGICYQLLINNWRVFCLIDEAQPGPAGLDGRHHSDALNIDTVM
jgi:hypothetical protein